MPRIKDVAQLAGVSTATVSRVLNGITVRPDLEQAVNGAIAQLSYAPDRTARSLRRRHSDVIALVLPDIENPFFTAVARGVEDAAGTKGYSVVLCNTDDLPDKELRYLTAADEENMVGVIIAPATDNPQIENLLTKGRRVIVLDRKTQSRVDHVTFDNVRLGREAAAALARHGFRRIACVTGPRETSTAVERADGWRAALESCGLAATGELLIHSDFRVDGGYDALESLLALDMPPDAVLATNNLVGVGVLRALADRHGGPVSRPVELGRTTPAAAGPQIGVAVIGDLPFATSRIGDVIVSPLNPRDLGVEAARMLLERIEGMDVAPRHVVQTTPPPVE